MNEEEMMVTISIEEYEHLKECKAQLIEILERKIAELEWQMAGMKMKIAINDAVPSSNTGYSLKRTEQVDNILLDKACMWLRENYIPPAFGDITKVKNFVEQFKQAMTEIKL